MQRSIVLNSIEGWGGPGSLRAPGDGQVAGGLQQMFGGVVARARAEGLSSLRVDVSASSHGRILDALRALGFAERPVATPGNHRLVFTLGL